jgi:hypothetical protein
MIVQRHALDYVLNSLPRLEYGILRDISQWQLLARCDYAGVGRDGAGQKLQQRGFPGAVRANLADAVAIVNR